MNTTMLLWLIVAVLLMWGGRWIWIAFRLWWITSKGGEMQYRFKLTRIHYVIAFQSWLYIRRLRFGSFCHKIRLWWWEYWITRGFKVKYPSYNPPASPHAKHLERDKR